jgi:hypothetical protein
MAVTAHWIQDVKSADGTSQLKLRSDLVGFHKIPGRHTGVHLAHCFFFITERIGISKKVSALLTRFYAISDIDSRLAGLHATMPATMQHYWRNWRGFLLGGVYVGLKLSSEGYGMVIFYHFIIPFVTNIFLGAFHMLSTLRAKP